MNWMTSGRHRALYSQRGRRRQMHFPSQVQRQRIKPTTSLRTSQLVNARDSATPWYIVPVGDDDESQDIRVLELERKGAMSAAELAAVEAVENITHAEKVDDIEARSSLSRKDSRGQEQNAQGGKKDTRCIFTPIKKARSHNQPPIAAHSMKSAVVGIARPPSSIASGVDMRFFNDGEELPHKSKRQGTKVILSDQVLRNAPVSSSSLHIDHTEDHTKLQPHTPRLDLKGDLHDHFKVLKAQQQLSDSEDDNHRAFSTNGRQLYRGDSHPWKANAKLPDGLGPTSAFYPPDCVSFNSPNDFFHDKSPVEASPLSFKMSRAEVLKSQISHKLSRPPSFTPPPSSPSPSTSTSSQGSLMLGCPPQGWQKKLLLAQENSSSRHDSALSQVPNNGVFTDVVETRMENALPHSTSSRSSSKASDDDSIIDVVVPIDAKERIMAIAASQSYQGKSQARSQQLPETILGSDDVATRIDWKGKSMTFHQSWVMSSRTKRILEAASVPKSPCVGNAAKPCDTKYREMESVAIYMYTLVQCYKTNEKIRNPLSFETSAAPDSTELTTEKSGRRQIIFSP